MREGTAEGRRGTEPPAAAHAASERLSCDVAVVGSGFAGSLAARVLRRLGREVILVERGRHPRFALGESSTPLAALSLEDLAGRYGLADLRALAAHGRWIESHPHLRRGLKRGFTFFGHRAGEAFTADGAGCWWRPAPPTAWPTATGCARTSTTTW